MEKLAAYVVREGGLSTADAVGWIVRLSSTLEPIHGLGVSHGRVSAKAIQIAGSSCTSVGHLLDAGDLTDDPAYFSLERLVHGKRTAADDTWAVGVTLYRMLTGELPYRGATLDEMRQLIAGAPPSPLAVFDVGDDHIQAILDEVFTSAVDRRLVRLEHLRQRIIQARPQLAGLSPLEYGKPVSDDDDDDDDVLTTAVFHFDERDGGEDLREAKRRIVGASALPQGMNSPRSVRPPPRPTATSSPPLDEPDIQVLGGALPALPPLPNPSRTPSSAQGAASSPPSPRDVRPAPPVPPLPRAASAPPVPPLPPQPAVPPTASGSRGPRAMPLQQTPPPVGPAPFTPPQAASSQSAPVVPTLPLPPLPGASAKHRPPDPGEVGDHTSSQAHIASIQPVATRRRSRVVTYLLGATCLLAGAAAAYFTLRQGSSLPAATPQMSVAASASALASPSSSSAPAATAAPSATASLPRTSATATQTATSDPVSSSAPTSAASSMPSAPGSASPSAPSDAGETEVTVCVASLFEPETFADSHPDFSELCSTSNPVHGARDLRREVVRAGGGTKGVTPGMSDMSTMGWYRLAAFSIIRGHCCNAPPPIETPTLLDCNLDHTLERLTREANGGGDLASDAALKQVTYAFYCLARAGGAEFFDQQGMPNGGELTTFFKLLARVRKKSMSSSHR